MTRIFFALSCSLLIPLHALATTVTVTHTFDSDTLGWTISGDATSGAATWNATGGNPDGHVSATDSVAGGVWYYEAPSSFLTNFNNGYGQEFSFDISHSGSGSLFNAAGLIFNGGGIELTYAGIPAPPIGVGNWQTNTLILVESGWQNGGFAASQAEMETVLNNLNRLRIRGEYISGPDTGRLDNVAITTVVPIPGALWLLLSGVASAVACAQRRRN